MRLPGSSSWPTVVDAARSAGAAVGGMHPLQTFPLGEPTARRLHGITFGIAERVLHGRERCESPGWIRRLGVTEARHQVA